MTPAPRPNPVPAGGAPQATEERAQTDRSLKTERNAVDGERTHEQEAAERAADAVVEVARTRADAVAGEPAPGGTVDRERTAADALLARERAEPPPPHVAGAREATDEHLSGERSGADRMLVDQREANAHILEAALGADEARARAEESEREHRRVAEIRELFIGVLGHDLRNPLAAIQMSAATMLRNGHLTDADSAIAGRIIRSSQRMVRMIAQLLDLTRTRLGAGLPLARVPTDLAELCRNVAEEFEFPVRLALDDGLTGTWDPDRLAEVLSNLTGNAIDHATPGTPVDLRAHREGGVAVVEVSNAGAPIPPDVLPFLFEPFRQGKLRPHKSPKDNLGLGLYIAKQIALAHGGTLEGRSDAGRTTFSLRLPRAADAAC